tara:strand:+ start:1180 stop:1377 length:198 start_codon:yes stop_codon:yes gene_type:complete
MGGFFGAILAILIIVLDEQTKNATSPYVHPFVIAFGIFLGAILGLAILRETKDQGPKGPRDPLVE